MIIIVPGFIRKQSVMSLCSSGTALFSNEAKLTINYCVFTGGNHRHTKPRKVPNTHVWILSALVRIRIFARCHLLSIIFHQYCGYAALFTKMHFLFQLTSTCSCLPKANFNHLLWPISIAKRSEGTMTVYPMSLPPPVDCPVPSKHLYLIIPTLSAKVVRMRKLNLQTDQIAHIQYTLLT